MIFKKHLHSVSRAASRRLGILRSWWVFHVRSLLWRCFWDFVLPVLECCSAVWCSAADTHLKQLVCVVSGASFLTEGVFECDIAHQQSLAVLCLLYKIRCNQMHTLYSALPEPYVPMQVTCGAPQDLYSPLSVSVECSCWPCIQWCGAGVFQEQG